MNKTRQTVLNAVRIPIVILIFLMLAFFLYYLIFMFVARMFRAGEYNYASVVRVVYGAVLLLVGILMERTSYPSWIKASVLAAAVSVFSITLSILLYENPLLSNGVVIAAAISAMIYLILRKKEWFYYYGILLSLSATLFYIR